MRRQSGFTMIELMVTVAVLAALVAWGIPAFERLAEKMRLMRATEPVYERLVYAHSEAIKRFRPIVVSFSAAGTETWSLGVTDKIALTGAAAPYCDPTKAAAAANDDSCTLDTNNAFSADGTGYEPFLVRTDSADVRRVVMVAPAFNGGVAYTVFEEVRGLAREGATDRNGPVVLTTPHFETRVQVAASGNIRICSPAGTTKVFWYPDC